MVAPIEAEEAEEPVVGLKRIRSRRRMTSLVSRIGVTSLCAGTHSNHSPNTHPYYRIEKVKFGVPLDQVCGCHNDIPGPLLILILKLNKEAPFKKDVFRAPGHQANMKKLIHFLQTGRLVNIDNFSVYTIASVLKKFLRKLPGGIFGSEIESRLFDIIQWENVEEKREEIHKLISSLPVENQHLLVLLFGTFRAIASAAERANTGMTSEALGVSVAPSFFQSCVSDGSKIAKMEDVQRFKIATTIMKFLIDNFGISNLFGRENYEYYARISGRVLKVEENWFFSFMYPPEYMVPRKTSLEAEREWLQREVKRWGLPLPANRQLQAISSAEECQSTPTLCPSTSATATGHCRSGHGSQAHTVLGDEAYARLSMSLEENVFKVTRSSPPHTSPGPGPSLKPPLLQEHQPQAASQHLQEKQQHQEADVGNDEDDGLTLDDLRIVNRYAESTKSLSFLPMVHERQTQRMKTRSEWFLNPAESEEAVDKELQEQQQQQQPQQQQQSGSSKGLIRRTSSKEKRLVRRSSSKKDKENGNSVPGTPGSGSGSSLAQAGPGPGSGSGSGPGSGPGSGDGSETGGNTIQESDCTEESVHMLSTLHTYKPRI